MTPGDISINHFIIAVVFTALSTAIVIWAIPVLLSSLPIFDPSLTCIDCSAYYEYYGGYDDGYQAGLGITSWTDPSGDSPYRYGYEEGYLRSFGFDPNNATILKGGGVRV